MFASLIALDDRISLFFRSLVPLGSPLVPVVRVMADIEVFLVVGLLMGWWLRGVITKSKDYRIQALDLFYAIGLAFAIYWVLNFGLPMRPRPETISSLPPLINHLPDNSFPSGHAIFAGASVFGIARYLSKKLAWAFGIIAVLMLLSRVIAGVHYFGDVLAGTVLGVCCAWLYGIVREKLGSKTQLHVLPIKIAHFIRL